MYIRRGKSQGEREWKEKKRRWTNEKTRRKEWNKNQAQKVIIRGCDKWEKTDIVTDIFKERCYPTNETKTKLTEWRQSIINNEEEERKKDNSRKLGDGKDARPRPIRDEKNVSFEFVGNILSLFFMFSISFL